MTRDEFYTALKETGYSFFLRDGVRPHAIRFEHDRSAAHLCPIEAVYLHRTGRYDVYVCAGAHLGLSDEDIALIADAADGTGLRDVNRSEARRHMLNVLNLVEEES